MLKVISWLPWTYACTRTNTHAPFLSCALSLLLAPSKEVERHLLRRLLDETSPRAKLSEVHNMICEGNGLISGCYQSMDMSLNMLVQTGQRQPGK